MADLGGSSKRRAHRREKAVGQGVGRAAQLESGEGAGGTDVHFHFEAEQKINILYSEQSCIFHHKMFNTQTGLLKKQLLLQVMVRDENKDEKDLKLFICKILYPCFPSHSC